MSPGVARRHVTCTEGCGCQALVIVLVGLGIPFTIHYAIFLFFFFLSEFLVFPPWPRRRAGGELGEEAFAALRPDRRAGSQLLGAAPCRPRGDQVAATRYRALPVFTTRELKISSLLHTLCCYFPASEECCLLVWKGKARFFPTERKREVRTSPGRPPAAGRIAVPR